MIMINQKYRITLLLSIFLILSGRSDSDILESVKFQIIDEATREPLKNCELNICKFLTLKPGSPSPYSDKAAEWYITSVVTDENGIFKLDLLPIKEKHIVVQPGELYRTTRFSRTSDLIGTNSANHIKVTYFQRGLTNKIYDLDTGKVKIITDSGEVTEEPFTEILLEVRRRENELCSESKAVMLQFQQALKSHHWDKALGLCSENVKSKANDYDSAEAFFKDIVPVDEFVPLPRFQTSGGRYNRQNQRIAYFCFLRIPTKGSIDAVDWEWTIRKNNQAWLIDFDTIPLEKWIEKETFRLTNAAAESHKRLETMRKGFEIKLTALDKEFVIGQPMLFRVEMHNISKSPIRWMHTSSAMVNDSMFIKGPDGNIIPYVDTSYQTEAQDKEIKPGEKVILADQYDVTTQYCITTPGRYTFQFNGFKHYEINPSNIVEIKVKPGKLLPADSIIEQLLTVLPEDWKFTRTLLPRRNTSEKTSHTGTFIHLTGQGGYKGFYPGIGVLMLVSPMKSEVGAEPEGFKGLLWGRSKWGLFYVKSFDADILWPDYREQIIKALEIE
jgi:hypothetical protein